MESFLVLKTQIPIKKRSFIAVQKAVPQINHIHFRTQYKSLLSYKTIVSARSQSLVGGHSNQFEQPDIYGTRTLSYAFLCIDKTI